MFDNLGFLPSTPPIQFHPTTTSTSSAQALQVDEDGAKFSQRKNQGISLMND